MASIKTGVLSATHVRLAASVALYTANMSFPSTLITGIPYPIPLDAIPSPAYWSRVGVDIA